MRRTIILAGWAWSVVALVALSDTGAGFFAAVGLILTGPVIGLAWVVSSFASPAVFRERRLAWPSVPVLAAVPVVLWVTGWGLIGRIALCEPALRAFAEEVQNGRAEGSQPEARWVGLFRVWWAGGDEREVVLMTSSGLFEFYGLAYRPKGPPGADEPNWRYEHLYGPWYRYWDGL